MSTDTAEPAPVTAVAVAAVSAAGVAPVSAADAATVSEMFGVFAVGVAAVRPFPPPPSRKAAA